MFIQFRQFFPIYVMLRHNVDIRSLFFFRSVQYVQFYFTIFIYCIYLFRLISNVTPFEYIPRKILAIRGSIKIRIIRLLDVRGNLLKIPFNLKVYRAT